MSKMPDPFGGGKDQFPAYLNHWTNSAAASKEHSALHYLFIWIPYRGYSKLRTRTALARALR